MTEPEISRRCLSCGASVRQMALFCPQCGQPLNYGDVDESVTQNSEQDGRSNIDPLLTQPLISAEVPKILETQPLISQSDRRDTVIDLGVPLRAEEPQSSEPGPLGRVEKIKKVSSVVLDQAAYDPSLRFLLVAAILFVIFLVLMILSKVIG